jgi:hypothetical protein
VERHILADPVLATLSMVVEREATVPRQSLRSELDRLVTSEDERAGSCVRSGRPIGEQANGGGRLPSAAERA